LRERIAKVVSHHRYEEQYLFQVQYLPSRYEAASEDQQFHESARHDHFR
uniref:Transcriptional regulator n=1 Tax=Brugia timori TaxID=42155 RepID=A0A0R3QFY9_9BILA